MMQNKSTRRRLNEELKEIRVERVIVTIDKRQADVVKYHACSLICIWDAAKTATTRRIKPVYRVISTFFDDDVRRDIELVSRICRFSQKAAGLAQALDEAGVSRSLGEDNGSGSGK